MVPLPLPTRHQALVRCLFVALTVLACTALACAAALVPGAAGALPFVIVLCLGMSASAATELPRAIAALRHRPVPLDAGAVERLRRHLDELPETKHPLGL